MAHVFDHGYGLLTRHIRKAIEVFGEAQWLTKK
jgi:hypothetical protein